MTPIEILNRLAELQKDATKGPWETGEASWNEDGEVRYTLHGNKYAKVADCQLIAQSGSTDFAALAAYVDRLEGALRSIELSVDAVNGGGKPEKALSQIKGKCRKALGEKP